MSRRPYLTAVLLTLVTVVIPIGAHARGGNNPPYEGVVDFGAQQLYLPDGCLSVDGSVTSGNFFAELKRIDVDGQSEYRKRGTLVTEYPESITTSIRVVGDRCDSALSSSPSSLLTADSYSLKFAMQWKNGMELRPALLSPGARCSTSSLLTNSSKDSAFPAITCQMSVNSKGVPLTDHLIVSVFAPDGKCLTRLSAAP